MQYLIEIATAYLFL